MLIEFVGPLAIYGDVNDILEASMSRMKDFVETTNLKKLQASRQAERKAAEREQGKRQKQLHKVHGSGAAASHAVFVVVTALVLLWWCGNQKRQNRQHYIFCRQFTEKPSDNTNFIFIFIYRYVYIYIIPGCSGPLSLPNFCHFHGGVAIMS